jgi:hypothetical protein
MTRPGARSSAPVGTEINRTFPHLAMRLRGGENTDAYVYTAEHDALRRLGACCSDDAARRTVESAVGTEEGALCLELRPGLT